MGWGASSQCNGTQQSPPPLPLAVAITLCALLLLKHETCGAAPRPVPRSTHCGHQPAMQGFHHTLHPLPHRCVQLESQKRMVESTLRRAAFTAAQLDEMPEDVATYRSVGKA